MAEIAVPGAEGLIVTKDALWVAAATGAPSLTSFVRIDPETSDITRTIPTDMYGAAGIGYGSVWITSFDDHLLARYDLETGERVASIPTGRGPDGALIAEGSVWVPDHFGGSVTRVDPATNEVTATIVLGAAGRGGPAALATVGGRIWVTEPLAQQLTGIDPETNDVVTEFDLDLLPCGITEVDGRLWVSACLDTEPLFQIVDPETGPSLAVLAPDGAESPMVVDDRIWVVMGSRFVALDPRSLEVVHALALREQVHNAVNAFGSVWAVTAESVIQLERGLFTNPD